MKYLILTQGACSLLVLTGITVEVIYQANMGFLCITIGSAIFAVTTKIENYLLTKRKE